MSLAAASRAVAGSDDTIAAEATAPGRGALSLIRVSGRRCHEVGRRLIAQWPATPRQASLCDLRDASGRRLDTAIVIRYDAPASFTGEDALEITTHGGAAVPATVLAALIAAGARQALPGEFTRRAVLNGKLDLLQAEAIGDLVAATSRAAQRQALDQLDGGLSRRLTALRAELLAVEAMIAYDIDFPEEDDGPISGERILSAVDSLRSALDHLLATADAGELVRDGALVVLAGVPNAGKSSLFNALIGQRRAIVTDVPGTTRDAIEAVIDVDRYPLRLVDTAGIRDTMDSVERMGVDVSYDYLRRAAVVLACGATDGELMDASRACAGKTDAAIVLVRTKSDLPAAAGASGTAAVPVSALTGEGLESLCAAIVVALETGRGVIEADTPLLTRTRHRSRVALAKAELDAFRSAWRTERVPPVVAAVHLRTATAALEELIGRVDVEDILDEVFARFCVGK
jgi:tRNA modification GTPase